MQRVNEYVFHDPVGVICNIDRVTNHLRQVIAAEGGDVQRGTLQLLSTRNGQPWAKDNEGGFWRVYTYVDGTILLDLPDTPELFSLSGEAFGRFQRQLSSFPAAALTESIPHFHDTPARFQQLLDALQLNASGRLAEVQPEVDFCLAREKDTHVLMDALAEGKLPLRVTHNDTKLNNVLLDAVTREAVCVVDLDTVMPGLVAYDFGDSIRFGASTAAEDEQDLSKVSLSLPMYEAFTKGFLKEAGKTLTAEEIRLLPWGAKLMTLECGMRFLADHLNGDKYFRIHRPGQNLDRARTQFALVQDMEAHWEEMAHIVQQVSGI